MTAMLIPETAPFSSEQRAWLNGFFAGMLGLNETNGTMSPGLVASSSSVVIEQTVEEIADTDLPWHDPGLSIDERMEATKDQPVEMKLMAAMAQLNCGACGYLCRTYSTAIATGEEKSLTKCVPGGKPTSKMLKKILEENPVNVSSSMTLEKAATEPASRFSRDTPLLAKLVQSSRLNAETSEKDTRHVVIDLGESGLTYQVGDALGVYPSNCDELVESVMSAIAADRTTTVEYAGSTMSLSEVLTHHVCLKGISDDFIDLVKKSLKGEEQRAELETLIDEDEAGELDILDVLHNCPGMVISAQEFVTSLSPLSPRLYSIASSQKINHREVHLTVGRQIRHVKNRIRKGVASTMFSDRLQAGSDVRVYVHPAHAFHVPVNDDKPLIMVGPGTGIAPFRAFLQERAARNARGKNWLFFGDQRSESDFLYREELDTYLQTGQLTRLSTAFSRDQEQKVYVQDRMMESAVEIFEWLEEGGSFCVCGDARRMARDVDQTLHAIIEQQGKMTAAQAKAYVLEMVKQKRYLRDVY